MTAAEDEKLTLRTRKSRRALFNCCLEHFRPADKDRDVSPSSSSASSIQTQRPTPTTHLPPFSGGEPKAQAVCPFCASSSSSHPLWRTRGNKPTVLLRTCLKNRSGWRQTSPPPPCQTKGATEPSVLQASKAAGAASGPSQNLISKGQGGGDFCSPELLGLASY